MGAGAKKCRATTRAKESLVLVLDGDRRPHRVRCVFRRGSLAVTEEIHAFESGLRDEAWRVVHLPSGGALPCRALPAARAKRLLLATETLAPWKDITTIEDVAALPGTTKAQLRAAIDVELAR